MKTLVGIGHLSSHYRNQWTHRFQPARIPWYEWRHRGAYLAPFDCDHDLKKSGFIKRTPILETQRVNNAQIGCAHLRNI
jgi:hypothetical protein